MLLQTTPTKLYDLLLVVSRTLDLVGGEFSLHGLRVAYGSWQLAKHCGLPSAQQKLLTMAGLIHDVGVSSSLLRHELVNHFEVSPEHAYGHAQRGSDLLRPIDHAEALVPLIRFHHHRFDSNPDGMSGASVPVESQILHLIDRVAVLIKPRYILHHRDWILKRVRDHAGKRFDPYLVDALDDLAQSDSFWLDLTMPYLEDLVAEFLSDQSVILTHGEIRPILQMLAQVIDDKSPFTHSHSVAVARVARQLARDCQLPAQTQEELEWAGLVHDLGKLAIPDEILDKPSVNPQRGSNHAPTHLSYLPDPTPRSVFSQHCPVGRIPS